MECVYSQSTSEHGVSKPICQKNFKSSPPKPFMGRLKLFKNAFKPTIAEDVTSFKNYPGWILGYSEQLSISNVRMSEGTFCHVEVHIITKNNINNILDKIASFEFSKVRAFSWVPYSQYLVCSFIPYIRKTCT